MMAATALVTCNAGFCCNQSGDRAAAWRGRQRAQGIVSVTLMVSRRLSSHLFDLAEALRKHPDHEQDAAELMRRWP